METQPGTVICGGESTAYFETTKPFWFDHFSRSYVVEKPMAESGFLPETREYIAGAGMVVRKKFIQELNNRGYNLILTDRKGSSLMSGADVELCLLAKYSGYKIYFEKKLTLVHFMPACRLNWEYCIRLTTFGQAIPEITFDIYRSFQKRKNTRKKSIFILLYFKLLLKYKYNFVFPEYHIHLNIKRLIANYKSFHNRTEGSETCIIMLSAWNKIFYLLKHYRLFRQQFFGIREFFNSLDASR
jgi:hypothetical protein